MEYVVQKVSCERLNMSRSLVCNSSIVVILDKSRALMISEGVKQYGIGHYSYLQ